MKFTIFAAILPTIIKTSHALQCGTSLTTDCIADTDIRYDTEYTNDLLKQSSYWDNYSGLGIGYFENKDADGNPWLLFHTTLRQERLAEAL